MNDNDIIKALECCRVGKREHDCKKCPLYCRVPACMGHLTAEAHDLINRQKAEIEKLTAKNRKLSDVNNDLNYQTDVWNPSQAIKEFAGRLKEELDDPKTFGGWSVDIIMDRIDNLVKEMTEEQE